MSITTNQAMLENVSRVFRKRYTLSLAYHHGTFTSKHFVMMERSKPPLMKLQTENNIEPGIISHNILLDACLKTGDQSLFDAVIQGITRKGLQQDVTYNSRITMLCGNNNNNPCETEKLFDEMLSRGLKPNSVSYNTLLTGFCKNGELASGVRWFNKMQEKNMVDGGSYVMVMKLMVEKGEMSQAVNICKECLGKKWAPPFDVIRTIVDGLVKDSMVKEARSVSKDLL